MLNAGLLAVLLIRKRLEQFSFLALWSAFSILAAALLFWAMRQGDTVYAWTYWSVEAMDAMLQLLIVAQVAWIVFHPLRIRTGAPWRRLTIMFAACTAVALLLAFSVHPPAHTLAGAFEIRGQLFTSILICCVFTSVLFLSQQQALYWRSHVMTVGYGLTAWAIVSLAIDLLHAYLGRTEHFLALEHVRMLAYLCIFLYWIVALWRNEPEGQNLPRQTQNAILQAAHQVGYDLAQVLGDRSPGQDKENP